MGDGKGDLRQDTQFVNDERTIFTAPKNNQTEYQVRIKKHRTQGRDQVQPFIDIREWWFKDGHLEEPLATRKGTMINRVHIPKLILALISEMQPDEVSAEIIASMRSQLARLEGKID